jgi:hypothetical protein
MHNLPKNLASAHMMEEQAKNCFYSAALPPGADQSLLSSVSFCLYPRREGFLLKSHQVVYCCSAAAKDGEKASITLPFIKVS